MGCLSFQEMDELVDEKDWGPVLAEHEGLPMLGQHGCEHQDGHSPLNAKDV